MTKFRDEQWPNAMSSVLTRKWEEELSRVFFVHIAQPQSCLSGRQRWVHLGLDLQSMLASSVCLMFVLLFLQKGQAGFVSAQSHFFLSLVLFNTCAQIHGEIVGFLGGWCILISLTKQKERWVPGAMFISRSTCSWEGLGNMTSSCPPFLGTPWVSFLLYILFLSSAFPFSPLFQCSFSVLSL